MVMTTASKTNYAESSANEPKSVEPYQTFLTSPVSETTNPMPAITDHDNVLAGGYIDQFIPASPSMSFVSEASSTLSEPLEEDSVEINVQLVEADDNSYQSLFPLSRSPWTESDYSALVSACPPQSTHVLPPTGLIAEANCIIEVAEAERDVCMAEQRLAHCRVKESILKACLYKIQNTMATRLIQISNSKVGRARAGRERIAQSHVRPHILNKATAMRSTQAGHLEA